MCGRYFIPHEYEQIRVQFEVADDGVTFQPRFNATPGQELPVIINTGESRSFQRMRWGLIPFWSKDEKIGNRMINARAETVHEKPSFKTSLKKRRCLIVAGGFYEWKKEQGSKVPYCICLKDEKPFSMAGLWDCWKSPDGKEIYSYTIITTSANELMKPYHHRMPVIFNKEQENIWLNPEIEDIDELRSLLTQYPPDKMKVYKVSTIVNSPFNDSPECIRVVR